MFAGGVCCTGNAFSYSSLHRRKCLEADYGNPNIYSALEEDVKLDNRTLENVYDEINRGGGGHTRASRKSLDTKSSRAIFCIRYIWETSWIRMIHMENADPDLGGK